MTLSPITLLRLTITDQLRDLGGGGVPSLWNPVLQSDTLRKLPIAMISQYLLKAEVRVGYIPKESCKKEAH